jgi:hypothetical protein
MSSSAWFTGCEKTKISKILIFFCFNKTGGIHRRLKCEIVFPLAIGHDKEITLHFFMGGLFLKVSVWTENKVTKHRQVEMRGIEPLASALRTLRSPN